MYIQGFQTALPWYEESDKGNYYIPDKSPYIFPLSCPATNKIVLLIMLITSNAIGYLAPIASGTSRLTGTTGDLKLLVILT